MKHIFLMNPAAGKGKAGKIFLPQIIETAKRMGIDYEIHRTIAPGDAEHYVRERCKDFFISRGHMDIDQEACVSDNHTSLRFYACGGDGTLNEVANGAYGYSFAEIAMLPAGTGNDFPRIFGDKKFFMNIEAQIQGKSRLVDLIRYTAAIPGGMEGSITGSLDRIFEPEQEPVVRFGINMFNIGLDCNVADKMSEVKQHPFVPGPLAYGISVGMILGKKEGVDLSVTLDTGEVFDGAIMLIAFGSGNYCGGGFRGLPLAKIDDGLMDISIVRDISRRTFLSLIGKYRKGTHLADPSTRELLTYRTCRSLSIRPKRAMKLCIDGEISIVGETSFEIVPSAIKFSVPQGCGE